MKFTIQKAVLEGLAAQAKAVAKKSSTMPVTEHVLIHSVGSDSVRATATDMEVWISAAHEAKVSKPGGLTVSAAQLHDLARTLPDGEVSFEADTNAWVKVKAGRANFRLVGGREDTFPKPDSKAIDTTEIGGAGLRELLEGTEYAVSTDETRYNLTGVFLSHDTGRVVSVATDGHRLAVGSREVEGASVFGGGSIVPRKGIAELLKLIAGSESVRVGIDERNLIASAGGVSLSVRLVDGRFPDYRQVIPAAGTEKTIVRVSRDGLLDALGRMRLLSKDKASGVKLEIAEGVLTLSASNPDAGSGSEEMDVETPTLGSDRAVGINAAYLVDAIKNTGGEQVEILLIDQLSPVRVRGVGVENALAVVMPMRV